MQKSFLPQLRSILIFSATVFVMGELRVSAQDFLTGGSRGGISFNEGNHRFGQAEAFDETTSAFMGTAGPLLELRKGHFPLVLEGGASPTLISRYRFGSTDFGEDFQFTSHIGLAWYITDHLSVGCRFQHMSNAGLAKPNPGLNVGMLVLSYHF